MVHRGPAKSTWQKTIKTTDKSSWNAIVSVYKGQYGVHMDPRTAYQCCHELPYSQFMSVQGLMNTMRDYQRIAPRKLTDDSYTSTGVNIMEQGSIETPARGERNHRRTFTEVTTGRI